MIRYIFLIAVFFSLNLFSQSDFKVIVKGLKAAEDK
jgi:hypothetical protein